MGIRDTLRGVADRLGWGPAPVIETRDAVRQVLMEEASLVAQKCLIGYCHARTQLPISELMREARFSQAFEQSRAQAITAVLADFYLVLEGRLRHAAGARASAIAAALADLYRDSLAREPAIAGRIDVANAVAELERRIAVAQLASPKPSAEVAEASGLELFETLPIHERLRKLDRPAVVASVRFMLMSRFQILDRRLDLETLADRLATTG